MRRMMIEMGNHIGILGAGFHGHRGNIIAIGSCTIATASATAAATTTKLSFLSNSYSGQSPQSAVAHWGIHNWVGNSSDRTNCSTSFGIAVCITTTSRCIATPSTEMTLFCSVSSSTVTSRGGRGGSILLLLSEGVQSLLDVFVAGI